MRRGEGRTVRGRLIRVGIPVAAVTVARGNSPRRSPGSERSHRVVSFSAAPTAVLVISEDLDEILGLCDRIVVLYEGRIMGERAASPRFRNVIGLLMAGVDVEPAEAV